MFIKVTSYIVVLIFLKFIRILITLVIKFKQEAFYGKSSNLLILFQKLVS